jgi:hypothetical protein
MKFQAFYDSPFILNFSFEKLIEKMEAEASDNPNMRCHIREFWIKRKNFPNF